MNNCVLTGLLVAVLVVGVISGRVKAWKAAAAIEARNKAAEQADLEREKNLALLVRDRSRYACNYAANMFDTRLSKRDREPYRQRYEQAKSDALVELLRINDGFIGAWRPTE